MRFSRATALLSIVLLILPVLAFGQTGPVRCHVALGSGAAIPNADSSFVVPWNIEIDDPLDMHSMALNLYAIVVPSDGFYHADGSLAFSTGTGTRTLTLMVGNATFYVGSTAMGGGAETWLAVSGGAYCKAGDKIYLWAWQNSGHALTTGGVGGRLSVVKIN